MIEGLTTADRERVEQARWRLRPVAARIDVCDPAEEREAGVSEEG